MSQFVENLLSEFAQRPPKDDLGEECLAAEEAILKFRATGAGNPEMVAGLVETEITAADVAALTIALQAFIEACPEHPYVGSAIWALSKLDDEALIPFFLAQIHRHTLARRVHPVQQANYALGRFDHDTYQQQYIPGQFDEASYWQDVEDFLRRHPPAT